MSTTIPALDPVTDILDTDKIMVTQSSGQTYTISGANFNKRNQVVIASNTTVTGTPLKTGNVVRIYFTADVTGVNATSVLKINYNGTNYNVKVPKNGALVNFTAQNLGGSPVVYKYLQAYTTLELIYDGTQFVILGNPVIISTSTTRIFADGSVVYTSSYNIQETYIPSLTDANLCIPANRRETTYRVYGSNTPTTATYFIKSMMTTESQKRIVQIAYRTQSASTSFADTYVRIGYAALNSDEWTFGDWKQFSFVS